MKKKLEAELISIAHRILKLKNKSELIQLHQETQKLYEKLSVLKFVEENFSEVKPTIGHAEIEEKLETVFDNYDNNPTVELQTVVVEEEEVVPEVIEEEEEAMIETTPENAEESIIEVTSEEVVEEPLIEFERKTDFEPTDEVVNEEIVFETPETKKASKQISLEDLLSDVHSDPIFERVHKTEKVEDVVEEKAAEIVAEEPIEEEVSAETEAPLENPSEIILEKTETPLEEKPVTRKDSLNKITFGLNDRIAFEKQLFGGSSEDLNRVISQLSTYDTFQEAKDFIEEMVKPDYNNWEGKEDYAMRFMDIVEKKFS